MVSWSELEDEPSCRVLYPLQGVKCRLREPGQSRVAVIQPRCDESQDEAHNDILTNATSNLTQTSQMIKTADDVLAMCDFIVSSESNRTPRTRTPDAG